MPHPRFFRTGDAATPSPKCLPAPLSKSGTPVTLQRGRKGAAPLPERKTHQPNRSEDDLDRNQFLLASLPAPLHIPSIATELGNKTS